MKSIEKRLIRGLGLGYYHNGDSSKVNKRDRKYGTSRPQPVERLAFSITVVYDRMFNQ